MHPRHGPTGAAVSGRVPTTRMARASRRSPPPWPASGRGTHPAGSGRRRTRQTPPSGLGLHPAAASRAPLPIKWSSLAQKPGLAQCRSTPRDSVARTTPPAAASIPLRPRPGPAGVTRPLVGSARPRVGATRANRRLTAAVQPPSGPRRRHPRGPQSLHLRLSESFPIPGHPGRRLLAHVTAADPGKKNPGPYARRITGPAVHAGAPFTPCTLTSPSRTASAPASA